MSGALTVRGDVSSARRAEILALSKTGTITPSMLLEQAAKPDSALHDLFVWDDTEAAQRYRVLQAAGVIRSFQVYITRRPTEERSVSVAILPPLDADRENTRPTRGFVNLGSDRGTGVYRSLERVLADPTLRAQYVADAKKELRAFRDKYQGIEELDRVLKAIDRELR